MTGPYSRIGRWVAELILVFVGVYAAFWLNNLQQHHQEAKRRDRILASLERLLEDGVANTKEQAAKQDREMVAFQRALQADEMPAMRRFTFTTDYNPNDIATLLQAGGIELLDVRTLTALRELESVIRWGLSRMAHYQKLSNELIAPNLDQEKTFFYDVWRETAETLRNLSRSPARRAEFLSRVGTKTGAITQANSIRAPAALSLVIGQLHVIRDSRISSK